jgi:hypothetical protein
MIETDFYFHNCITDDISRVGRALLSFNHLNFGQKRDIVQLRLSVQRTILMISWSKMSIYRLVYGSQFSYGGDRLIPQERFNDYPGLVKAAW